MLSDYNFEELEEGDYVIHRLESKRIGKLVNLNEQTGNVTIKWPSDGIHTISILPAYKLVKIGPEELI